MSNTNEWQKRLKTHRYSQDDRTLSYNFKNSLKETVDKFLMDNSQKSLVVGTFDLAKEPWRLVALREFRKDGLKLVEKKVNGGLASSVNSSLSSNTDSNSNLSSNSNVGTDLNASNLSPELTEFTLVKQKLSEIRFR